MHLDQFLQLLKSSGYPDPVEVQQAPNGHLDDHTHLFSVQALVIDGSIEIQTQGKTQVFKAGDVFKLDHEQVHSESYVPQGVKYLASRQQ